MLDKDFWFKKTEKKFLHNIDTFYFSVKLADDFTETGDAMNVKSLRQVIAKYRSMASGIPFRELEYEFPVLYMAYPAYAGFYNFWLKVPEQFDIVLAPVVPPGAKSIASVTSEIIVQIRACLLWEIGPKLAFDRAMEFVQAFCNRFELTIAEVKENRTDFCWHTNALQDPETYLRIDNFSEMQVSRFKRIQYAYQLKNKRKSKRVLENDEQEKDKPYENDYIALGKRGDKCFIRMYLKTKEVVEECYKGWFFYIWLFNGLISRYDLYILEKAYQKKSWNYCDIARLEFALEYDDTLPEQVRQQMKELVDSEPYNFPAIAKLANKYTPKLTKIFNVEYQVMRKMSKSFVLVPLKENVGVAKRVYDFLDNHTMIAKSLTHDTLRLVDPYTDDNISRCDYTDFWKRLRGTKFIDAMNKRDLKLVRDYTSRLNLEVRKTKALRAVSSFALTLNQDPEKTIYEDTAELLAVLNDNDMNRLHNYKYRRILQMKLPDEDEGLIDFQKFRHIQILNEDGEFFESS